MAWHVEFCDEFLPEFSVLPESVQDELLAHLRLLERFGPALGRPHVDTLKGSKHANMKELRFTANNGVWRAAVAFDPRRTAWILFAGDKAGRSEKRFYKSLIRKSDDRFDRHLRTLRMLVV